LERPSAAVHSLYHAGAKPPAVTPLEASCCRESLSGNRLISTGQKDDAPRDGKKPNILVIFGDDIGQTSISSYSHGVMVYRTPNIDRIAKEGMLFTDLYAEQSCTAGRSNFLKGQCTLRSELSKVGMPTAPVGRQACDATIAELLKGQGYATGQFGKNHLGDKNEYLPPVHEFDAFFGNLST
jgi:arylsulfatase A-like enzyme